MCPVDVNKPKTQPDSNEDFVLFHVFGSLLTVCFCSRIFLTISLAMFILAN